VLERLDKSGCVRRGGFIYVESPASAATKILPPEGWSVWRDQQIGDVRLQLFRRQIQNDERNLPGFWSDD
jgi:16S rRNA G966 N2-methylase RsmD